MASQNRPWTQQDRSELREFLAKHDHFIPILTSYKPKLLKTTLESTALTASQQEGFEGALDNLQSMSQAIEGDVTAPQFVNTEED